eukprot:g53200.t1
MTGYISVVSERRLYFGRIRTQAIFRSYQNAAISVVSEPRLFRSYQDAGYQDARLRKGQHGYERDNMATKGTTWQGWGQKRQ